MIRRSAYDTRATDIILRHLGRECGRVEQPEFILERLVVSGSPLRVSVGGFRGTGVRGFSFNRASYPKP